MNTRQKALLASVISQQVDFEAIDDEKNDSASNASSVAAATKEVKDSITDAKNELKNEWRIDPSVVQSVIDGTVGRSNAIYYYLGGAVLLGIAGFKYIGSKK